MMVHMYPENLGEYMVLLDVVESSLIGKDGSRCQRTRIPPSLCRPGNRGDFSSTEFSGSVPDCLGRRAIWVDLGEVQFGGEEVDDAGVLFASPGYGFDGLEDRVEGFVGESGSCPWDDAPQWFLIVFAVNIPVDTTPVLPAVACTPFIGTESRGGLSPGKMTFSKLIFVP
jgi:hypothetical protein